MPVIYGIEGILVDEDDGRNIRARWPVCWRPDPVEADAILKLCIDQRIDLYDRLCPLYEAAGDLMATRRHERMNLPGKRYGAGVRRQVDAIEQRFETGKSKLENQVAQIQADWIKDAFDPLFPLPKFPGSLDLVDHKIVRFFEDPREAGQAEIMRMRALLNNRQPDADSNPLLDFDDD